MKFSCDIIYPACAKLRVLFEKRHMKRKRDRNTPKDGPQTPKMDPKDVPAGLAAYVTAASGMPGGAEPRS